jgi:hypothetical protein
MNFSIERDLFFWLLFFLYFFVNCYQSRVSENFSIWQFFIKFFPSIQLCVLYVVHCGVDDDGVVGEIFFHAFFVNICSIIETSHII